MSLTASEIHQKLEDTFPGRIKRAELQALDPFLVVETAAIAEVGCWLRDAPEMAFETLHCLSAVDYPAENRMEVVYHLFSLQHRHWVILKVETARSDPRVATVEKVWKTANWHEREAYDLFGIRFEGHSDLRRILLPDDWQGYPLRKDWEWPEEWHGIPIKPGKQMAERAKEGEKIGIGPFE